MAARVATPALEEVALRLLVLESLVLDATSFTGPIPSVVSSLGALKQLKVSR